MYKKNCLTANCSLNENVLRTMATFARSKRPAKKLFRQKFVARGRGEVAPPEGKQSQTTFGAKAPQGQVSILQSLGEFAF
jgi:hypothetical protein